MYQIQKPTRFRRLVSTLLSLALVAGFAPGITVAEPPVAAMGDVSALAITSSTLTANGTTLTAGTEPWFKGNVDATITATPEADVATLAVGVNTESLTTTTTTNTWKLPTITAEGTTTVRFYSIDVAGSQEPTNTIYVKIDKTAPETTATATPSTWTSTTVSVHITATDALSGIDKVFYRVGTGGAVIDTTTASFTIPPISAVGTTTVSYWATDKAGNSVATRTVDARIDQIAPTTTSNRVATYFGAAVIAFTATDAGGSGVKATHYQLDGGAIQTGTVMMTTATTPAVHNLKFWSEDNAGNVENSAAASNNVTFTVIVETSAPITTLVTKPGLNLNDWQSSVVTFTLTATDTPAGANAGIANTFYRLDGGGTVTYTPGTVVTVSKEGITLLEYWSVDLGGVKEATKTAGIMIDRVNPSSTNSGTGPTGISVTAHDASSGIGTIQWWIDSGAPTLLTGFVSGATSVTVSIPPVSISGTHTVSYRVTDVAGNSENTRTVGPFHNTGNTFVTFTTKSAWLTNPRNPAIVTVAGKLSDGTNGIPGKQLLIDYSGTADFQYVVTIPVTTGSDGTFSMLRPVWNRSYYRIRFLGDGDYLASHSSLLVLVPRAGLSVSAPTTARAGRPFWITGSIKPAHAPGKRVLILRYQFIGGRLVYRGMTWTAIYPRGKTWSNFQAKLNLGRGTWYIRAYAPADAAHSSTYTTMRRIIVR